MQAPPVPAWGPPGPMQWAGQPSAGGYVEPHTRRRPSRSRKPLVFGLIAAVLLLVGGAAFGVNGYAKHRACSLIRSLGTPTQGGTATESGISSDDLPASQVRRVADDLRDNARMLFTDRKLHAAMDDLANDLDQLVPMMDQRATAELVGAWTILAASLNTHLTRTQVACNLPATGIFAN